MSPRSRSKPALILVFGESLNDAQSVVAMILGARPDLRGRVRPVPRPTSLTRDAGPPAVTSWVKNLRSTVAALQSRGSLVSSVVVHQDTDGPDPQGLNEVRLRTQLQGIADEVAVPVEEMEAWWLLFPGAVRATRPGVWRTVLARTQGDVDAVGDPKGKLMRETRRAGYEYSEADSVAIAEQVATRQFQPAGASASYTRWEATVGRLK